MTICLENNWETKKFYARCMFKGTLKDNTLPIFRAIHQTMNFTQVCVETDLTTVEIEKLLHKNHVLFRWVSEY